MIVFSANVTLLEFSSVHQSSKVKYQMTYEQNICSQDKRFSLRCHLGNRTLQYFI